MSPIEFRAGVAEVDITPPMGVEMCGYGPYEKRTCGEVLDPLFARALWLQGQGGDLVIISADLCTTDLAVRDRAASILNERFGVPPANVMIAATHTHSGPAVQEMIGWGERDAAYMACLPELFAEAASRAHAALTPARIGAARTLIHGVGLNRNLPWIGPTDPAAQILRVDRADGSPLGVLFNYGAHCVGRYPFTRRISADWAGLAAAGVKARTGAVAIFLQGACGDINVHEMTFARSDVDTQQKLCDMRVGEAAWRFCQQVVPAVAGIRTEPAGEIRASWKMLDLPCVAPDRAALEQVVSQRSAGARAMTLAQIRPLSERMASETPQEKQWREDRFFCDSARRQLELMRNPPFVRKAPVQVLRVGSIVFAGWPCEAFVELGMELRQRSPFPMTFLSTFTNDTAGYVPTPACFESKGKGNDFGLYPRERTPLLYAHLPYRADVGRVLVEETLAMIES